jgi:integrase
MGSPPGPELTQAIAARQRARAQEAERQERRIRQAIAQHAPLLSGMEKDAGLDKESLDKIVSTLENDDTGKLAKSIRRKLGQILVKLQKTTGGVVELPAPEVVLRRAPSPFAPDRFARVPEFSRTIQLFMADLEAFPDVESDIAAGRLVFSAIVFGGLLHSRLVNSYCPLVIADLNRHEDFLWIDLKLPKPLEESSDRVRRWFPDPVSQCLIARWQSASHCWPLGESGSAAQLLRELFARLRFAPLPSAQKLFNALLRDAQTRLRLLMPGILVDFLASDDHGQSLTSRVWWRLVADWQLEVPSVNKSEQQVADEIAATSDLPDAEPSRYKANSSEDLVTVGLLKMSLKDGKLFRKPKSALAKVGQLRERIGPSGPMLSAILDWVEWLMQRMVTGKRRARPQSVYRYLNSFAKALVAAAGELDPAKILATDLQEKYQMVLGSIRSSKERIYAAKRLRSFHSFLVLTREVLPVEIDGIVADRVDVRANIISEHEYFRALDLLSRTIPDDRGRRMLRAMLILGYRLGLRRGELAYVRLSDIHDESLSGEVSRRPLLWIHSHRQASLKTNESLRRLPLAHLLTPDELHEVLQWKRSRKGELAEKPASDALLFCERGQNSERLADRDIDVLVSVLRHVCRDDTIVLHSIRHSAISNMFARLFIAEIDRVSKDSTRCPWLVESPRWKVLVKRMFTTSVLPREAAYLISTIAGHIDPTETMHTYVHHQDWVAGLYLQDLAKSLPLSTWASLEGISVDAIMVRRSRHKRSKGEAPIASVDTPRRLLAGFKSVRPPGSQAEAIPSIIDTQVDTRSQLERLPVEGVYCVLALAARSMSDGAREHVSGIDRQVFKSLVVAAQSIAREKTSARNVEARRSRWLAEQPKRRRPQLTRLPQLDGFGPAIPRERTDRIDAREAYRNALLPDSIASTEELKFLLRRTSRTHPIITAKSLEDVERLTRILGDLGTPKRRIRIEIHSFPKSADDTRAWRRAVAKAGKLPLSAVMLASGEIPFTRSNRTHPGGRMAIHVVQEPRASDAKTGAQEVHRLACGWRVGSYYALCVKLALKTN